MSDKTSHPEIPWLGPEYFENRHKFPPDELAKYEDQHIAWSWDGSRILASARTEEELDSKLKQAGIDLSRVVYSYVPPMDVSQL
jgi:hypothetical protein